MPYAIIDPETKRILEWSEEHLFGFDTFFENGEYVNDNCIDGCDEFVIEDGIAVYKPLPEKEISRLKRNLEDTDYITSKTVDALVLCESPSAIASALASMKTKYASTLKKRQEWRDRINKIEREMSD